MVSAKQGTPARTTPTLLVGVLLYLVSWLVPVCQGQELFDSVGAFAKELGATPAASASALAGPTWLPGWGACRFAWSMLTEQEATEGEDWRRYVVGATCLTNFAMLAALLALACGWRLLPFGLLLLACAALNASWIYLGGEEVTRSLRAGYYLWAGSFVVTGIGMAGGGGRGA